MFKSMFGKLMVVMTVVAMFAVGVQAQKKGKTGKTVADYPLPDVSMIVADGRLCGGEVVLKTQATGGRIPLQFTWTVDKVIHPAKTETLALSLSPGAHQVLVEVTDGECTAYESRNIEITNCAPVVPPVVPCNEKVEVATLTTGDVLPGERFNLEARLTGANASQYAYRWSTSKGTIVGTGNAVSLDTTGVNAGDGIEVEVEVKRDAVCRVTSRLFVQVAKPAITVTATLQPRILTGCDSFKLNQVRVDNACKAILGDAVRQMQSSPDAQLVVIGYGETEAIAKARAKNVRDRLVDNGLGMAVDANRVITRIGGSGEVALILVPAGAELPKQGTDFTPGTITVERAAVRPQ